MNAPATCGPYQGADLIGEVTEALHAFLQAGWPPGAPAPRIVEDLAFAPRDRESLIHVCMYRVSRNTTLLNPKRYRQAHVRVPNGDEQAPVLYGKPPLYLDLHYLVATHARFRSEAERLLGHVLLRLGEATHLVYRPRRYILPDGRAVASDGRPWSGERREGVVMEKVSLALVDDLPLGEAVHFFAAHQASFRPYTTWRARCAMAGALVEAPGTQVRRGPVQRVGTQPPTPAGRIPCAPRRGVPAASLPPPSRED